MKERASYNTRQKRDILGIIKKQKKEFTIKEIYSKLENKTGLTTIYRLIDKLVINGELKKFIGKEGVTYYQYLEKCDKSNHFYLKCDQCGHIAHIDCDCINELSDHILKKHKFKSNRGNIVINGICDKCSK